MQVTAHLSSLRIAPRKVRSVTALLKGRDVFVAQSQLRALARRPSKPLLKLLNSALANAQHNHNLIAENLRIKEILVNGGPMLKRFEPKGFGSVSPIEKKTSHITITLEEKVPGLVQERTRNVRHEASAHEAGTHGVAERTVQATDAAKAAGRPEVKKELGKKSLLGGVKNIGRKFFRRKSI